MRVRIKSHLELFYHKESKANCCRRVFKVLFGINNSPLMVGLEEAKSLIPSTVRLVWISISRLVSRDR